MKKWIVSPLSCVMLLAMVTGCGGTPAESPSQPGGVGGTAPQSVTPDSETKIYKISFPNIWVGNAWGVQCVNELEVYLCNNEQISEYYIYNADNGANKQISDIEDLITEGVDMLILQPISVESVAAVVEEAYNAGVVVVNYTSPPPDATDKYNVSVVARDYDFGYMGAKWLCEELSGEDNIVRLDGMAGLSNAVLCTQGVQDAFTEYPGINVIASEYVDWDYATARPVMENLLAAYDDIDGTWSSGGDMTCAAIEVRADSGRDWIPMMGEDYNGFLKLWNEHKDDGLSCTTTSLPTWLFAYGTELGPEILNGTYEGEKDITVETPITTNDQVDDYVRRDLSDSFWCDTKMTEEDIVALYGSGNDGPQGLTGEGVATDH